MDPWHYDYADWLSRRDRASLDDRLEKARELSGYYLEARQIVTLEGRDAFHEYLHQMRGKAAERARAKLERDAEKYVEAHKQGLDYALERKDYRAIHNYTVPVLDRIAPKKDQTPSQTVVIVQLSAAQEAGLQDADYEVLPVQPDHGAPD
jgi:hypothetical protein